MTDFEMQLIKKYQEIKEDLGCAELLFLEACEKDIFVEICSEDETVPWAGLGTDIRIRKLVWLLWLRDKLGKEEKDRVRVLKAQSAAMVQLCMLAYDPENDDGDYIDFVEGHALSHACDVWVDCMIVLPEASFGGWVQINGRRI